MRCKCMQHVTSQSPHVRAGTDTSYATEPIVEMICCPAAGAAWNGSRLRHWQHSLRPSMTSCMHWSATLSVLRQEVRAAHSASSSPRLMRWRQVLSQQHTCRDMGPPRHPLFALSDSISRKGGRVIQCSISRTCASAGPDVPAHSAQCPRNHRMSHTARKCSLCVLQQSGHCHGHDGCWVDI